jgi:putative ABC transport system substrate-binding protein
MLTPTAERGVGQTECHDDDECGDSIQTAASRVNHRRKILRVLPSATIVAAVLVLIALPVAEPQTSPKVGYLSIGSATDPRRAALFSAFQQGLRDVGYVEGTNIVIEARFSEENYDRLPGLAAELVRLKVDVLVAYGTPAAQAAQEATGTIPIIMTNVVDPLRTGLVTSLGRPGRNITGLSLMAPEVIGKQMQLLKELIPRLSRVAVLWNPTNASNAPQLREAEKAAKLLTLHFQPLEVRGLEDLDRAFTAMTRERADGLLVVVEGVFIDGRARIARLAETARLPVVYGLREHVDAGGLMFYGANPADLNRRAAVFVDRIFKGAKPADLPVEQPTRFELVLNLKAAKALGLTISPALLQRADQVME